MKVHKVLQRLVSHPILDVAAEVRRELESLGLAVPAGDVAITVGSRGISQMPLIIRTVGDWLREKGARPFMAPCMGSHNGATAEGQRQMVEALGLTEAAMGMEIRSSMEVVRIGSVATGEVFMDRHCFEAAGVVVVNRIKLHTTFSGPVQSGLTKMMVVGMGKLESARSFHGVPPPLMSRMLMEMGQVAIDSGKMLAALAILEDGYDVAAEVYALRPEEIPENEPILLERHRRYFPRLPVEDLNVLVVDEIGKTFSGTGMDTNVIGYRGIKGYEDLSGPRIQLIAALGMAPGSQGNALGVGLADFITQRLRSEIDEVKTLINVLTSGYMERGKIPLTFPSDEALIQILLKRYGARRWMFIPNTLHLGTLYVSEDLAMELRLHPACEVDAAGAELTFHQGRHQLAF